MMLLPRTALVLLALGMLGPVGQKGVTAVGPFEPTTAPRVAPEAPPADTLRAAAEPGTPLLLPLPPTLAGRTVVRYTLLRGPALSGAAGRSFTWIPKDAAPGMHEVLLRAHRPDAPGDTLVLRVDLQS